MFSLSRLGAVRALYVMGTRRCGGGVLALGLFFAAACSSGGAVFDTTGSATEDGDSGADGGSLPTAAAGGGPGAGGATGGNFLPQGGFGGVAIRDSGAVCATTEMKAEGLGVDLYLMLDQSVSMGLAIPGTSITWWDATRAAVTNLVSNLLGPGNGVGIQYFPLAGPLFSGVNPDPCALTQYQIPSVEIAPMPSGAPAIVSSLGQHGPNPFTAIQPTGPALQGAVTHMQEWATNHPGRLPLVVLITDGVPTECEPRSFEGIAAIAAAARAGNPAIATAVIGLEGSQGLSYFDAIAASGGTGQAIRITGGDVQSELETALLRLALQPQISGSICTIALPSPPPSDPFDPERVNVHLRNQPRVRDLYRLNGEEECGLYGEDGWYYDDPTLPTEIRLCPASCADAALGGLAITFGCVTLAR